MRDKSLALFFTLGVSLKTWDTIGNIEREIELYDRLAEHFKTVYFLTYGERNEGGYLRKSAPAIRVMPNVLGFHRSIYSIAAPFIHWRTLKNIDLFKTNQMRGSWAAVIAARLFRKKLIVRCGYQWSMRAAKKGTVKEKIMAYCAEKLAYGCADGIIVSTEEAKRHITQNYRVKDEKITVIYNNIDTEVFSPADNMARIPGRIVYVGRLVEGKNLFSLLEAIKGLDVKLVVIGSGELRDRLEKKAAEDNTVVDFKGNIPNFKLPGELNRSEVVVLPSCYEGGHPKVLLEAMACGLPVIGTDVPGIRTLIQHEENGILCSTDSASIRNAVRRVMQDKRLRDRIGENARMFIVREYSLDVLLKKELKLMEQVLEQ